VPGAIAWLAVLTALAAPPAAAQNRTATERVTRTATLGPNGQLDLTNIGGNIVIRGGGSGVQIEAVKVARSNSDQESARQLKLVDVRVVEGPGRVEVQVDYPRCEHNVSVDVSFTVSVPASTRVNVKTISGDVLVAQTTGEVRVETISGRIRTETTSAVASLKTESGAIDIGQVGADADVVLATISGAVNLKNLTIKSLDVNSISGGILLSDLSVQRLDAGSISALVEYSGPLTTGGRYRLKSHSGGVKVTVTGSVGFELRASTFSGAIKTDLPLAGKAASGDRRGPDRRVQGTFGDASALLDLTSFSGTILVGKR
jgi:DUF4097 and DUF4098 domain-containing protein YvlB